MTKATTTDDLMYDDYYLNYLATIDKYVKSCIDVLHSMDTPLFDNSGSELEILVWDNNRGNHSLFVPEGDKVDLTPYLKEVPVLSDQRSNLPGSARLRDKGLRLIVEYLELKRKKLGLPEGKYQLSRESEGLRIAEKNGALALIAYAGNQLTPIPEPLKTLSFYFHSSDQMNLLLDLIAKGIDPSTVKEDEAEALASGLWDGAEVEEGYTGEEEPESKTAELEDDALEAAFASGAGNLREVLEWVESGVLKRVDEEVTFSTPSEEAQKPSETENARVLSSLWEGDMNPRHLTLWASTQERYETLQSYLNDAEVQRRSLPLGLSAKEAEKYLQQLQAEAEKLKEEEQKAPQEPSTTPDPTADTSVAQGIGLAIGVSLMLSAMKHSSSTSTLTRVSPQEQQPTEAADDLEEETRQRSNQS